MLGQRPRLGQLLNLDKRPHVLLNAHINESRLAHALRCVTGSLEINARRRQVRAHLAQPFVFGHVLDGLPLRVRQHGLVHVLVFDPAAGLEQRKGLFKVVVPVLDAEDEGASEDEVVAVWLPQVLGLVGRAWRANRRPHVVALHKLDVALLGRRLLLRDVGDFGQVDPVDVGRGVRLAQVQAHAARAAADVQHLGRRAGERERRVRHAAFEHGFDAVGLGEEAFVLNVAGGCVRERF